MLTFQELIERKLGDVGAPGQKVKDFEKDAHSQGIDLGPASKDAHHINYPKATFRRSGKPAKKADGTAIGGDLDGKGKFHSQKHTHGNTLRDAVKASGRVDKRPAAKAKRKEEAAANKAKKAKNRDPFTREHTEWWVNHFRTEATEKDLKAMGANPSQIQKLKQRQEKRGYGFNKPKEQGSHFHSKKPTETTATNPQKKIKVDRSNRMDGKKGTPVKSPRLDKYTTSLVPSKSKPSKDKPSKGGAIVKSPGGKMKAPDVQRINTNQNVPNSKSKKTSSPKKSPGTASTTGYMTAPDMQRKNSAARDKKELAKRGKRDDMKNALAKGAVKAAGVVGKRALNLGKRGEVGASDGKAETKATVRSYGGN